MRILVDQSGYDLLNIGDVAMLQSCVSRLQQQWPAAEIMVIAHEPSVLARYCPGVIAISQTLADLPLSDLLPRRHLLAAEQVWKVTAPYFAGRLGGPRMARVKRDPGELRGQPGTAIQAVMAADLVVASGGGYVTDSWWWHAAGVLSLLSLAQRLGKPTAMFGQGIGPVSRCALRAQATAVLPRLEVVGLREDAIGWDLVQSLDVSPDAVTVTGDDALELIKGHTVANGGALGVSLRVSGYAGVKPVTAAAIGAQVLKAAASLQAPIVGLPVSRYAADADVGVLRAILQPDHGQNGLTLDDIASPEELITASADCRAIVTGSYHAGVFGLAQGVPAVCLSKSSYYQAKFGGLQSLFPEACFVVQLDAPDWAARLSAAIRQAWHLPAPARASATDKAVRLRDAGREAYAQFRTKVEARR